MERVRVGKMNKKANVKHLAKREAEAENTKLKEEAEKAAERAKKAKRQEEREVIIDKKLKRDRARPLFRTRKKKTSKR